jgi:hypothetical protein
MHIQQIFADMHCLEYVLVTALLEGGSEHPPSTASTYPHGEGRLAS